MTKLSDKLLSSPGFCSLPFLHACVFPDGRARPCCINHGYEYGNTNKDLYSDIFSNKNDKLIKFRQQFLNSDTLPDSCSVCESDSFGNAESYRTGMNKFFKSELEKFTTEEELLNNEDYYSYDIRFSNLCNLRCHYCGPEESSRVAEEWTNLRNWPKNKVLIKNINDDNVDDFFKFFESNIQHIRHVYSCGGEPILLKEHYDILDLLLKHGVENQVQLLYNSNLTHLSLGNKNILDYWKKFPNIRINVSVDAGWEQFEYIRDGGKWIDIYNNLKKIVELAPHVKLQLSPVITFWNMLHFPKLYKFLIEENLIKRNHILLQPLAGVDHQCIHPSILPADIKQKIINHYSEYYSEYKELDYLLNTMTVRDSSHLLPETQNRIVYIDKNRNKDFYKTFPEFKDLFKGIKE
jgi:sulfatase maturation enzyme AslB (radical SAM superfamily)